jgi:bifunctional UDP-N-acetylglucosamine pyrophosphorylase/glucosamine-1-phosphate N-acetyltransferase
MRSALPKVLHTLGGRHLLQHVLGAAAGLGSARVIVVTGHGAAEVERRTSAPGLSFVRQEPQLGTGHALQQAAPLLDDDGITLILNGDVPPIETATLERPVAAAGPNRLRC